MLSSVNAENDHGYAYTANLGRTEMIRNSNKDDEGTQSF